MRITVRTLASIWSLTAVVGLSGCGPSAPTRKARTTQPPAVDAAAGSSARADATPAVVNATPADAAVVPTPDAQTGGGADVATDRSGDRPPTATIDAGRTDGARLGEVLFVDKIAEGIFSAFKPHAGTWAPCMHKDRMAYCQSERTGTTWALVGDPSWTDYEVEAVVVVDLPEPEKGMPIVGFRVASPDKFWAYGVLARAGQITTGWEHGQCDLKGCSHTNGSPFSHMPGEPFPIRFRVQGGSTTLYAQEWNSTRMAYGTRVWVLNKSYPAAGQLAIGSSGAAIKLLSLKVTRVLP